MRLDIMSLCTLNDINFYNKEVGGIPTISRVGLKDPHNTRFLDPSVYQKKQLFSVADQDGDNIFTMKAEIGYFYTLLYALEKIASNKIDEMNGIVKETKPKVIKEKDPKAVTDAVNRFKLDNQNNTDLYTVRYSVQPATYYSGKISYGILEESGMNELNIDDLASIVSVSSKMKKVTSDDIKATSNPWRAEKNYATKLGKHEEAVVRLNTLVKLGMIGKEEYDTQLDLVDNPPKREYTPRGQRVKKISYDNLTDDAMEVADIFNMLYCVNAINKDSLFARLDK